MTWEKCFQFALNRKLKWCSTWTVIIGFPVCLASGEVWTAYISNNSKTMAFFSTCHPSACVVSALVKPHPWPFSSPFFLLLSSLPLIFLWISAVCPNMSVPLSCLFFSFSFISLCALAHRWLRGVLARLFWLSVFLMFGNYSIPAAVLGHGHMPNTLAHIQYIKAGQYTYLHTYIGKNSYRQPMVNWSYHKQSNNSTVCHMNSFHQS